MKKSSLFACVLGAALGMSPLLAHLHAGDAHAATPAKPATTAPAKPAAAAVAPAAPSAPAAKPLVDLNSASKEELAKLPAIGEAIAAKIIAGRPWANKTQLLSKGLLSKTAYNKVAPLIVAKQAAK